MIRVIYDWEELSCVAGQSIEIPFLALGLDGISQIEGLVFDSDQLQIGRGFVELDSLGSVLELGHGWYLYSADVAETVVEGPISVRTNHPILYSLIFVANVIIIPPLPLATFSFRDYFGIGELRITTTREWGAWQEEQRTTQEQIWTQESG